MSEENDWTVVGSPRRTQTGSGLRRRFITPSPKSSNQLISNSVATLTPIATIPRNTSVTSLGSAASDDSSTMSDSEPKYDVQVMMETHTKEKTKELIAATRDQYEKLRYDLGSCYAKVPVKMDETKDASFLVDNETKWNSRHGTNGKSLPVFPQHPGYETRGMSRYDRTKMKREQKVHTLCKYLQTQGLDFIDAVFPGQFNTVKEHGAFKLNYTL